jgi:hypothetical protein
MHSTRYEEEAAKRGDIRAFEEMNKKFRKRRSLDNKEQVIKTLDKDLDERDVWMGIRNLKKGW